MVHLDMLVLAWILGLTAGNRGLQVSEDYDNSTLTLDTPELNAGSVINVKRTRNLGRSSGGGCEIYPGYYIEAGNIVDNGRKDTMQDCANWCKSRYLDKISCKAWTFNYAKKECWLKTTDGPLGCPMEGYSTSQWVTGTRNCGEFASCSDVLNVQGKLFSGKYTMMDNYHHDKPVYKFTSLQAGKIPMCIFFGNGIWMVDGCHMIRVGGATRLGAFSKIDAKCPQFIGQGWRSNTVSGYPIAPSIKITC